jgi:hypothetical protein
MKIQEPLRRSHRFAFLELMVVLLLVCGGLGFCPGAARAAVVSSNVTQSSGPASSGEAGGALESAATRAGDTGRKVAMSLIGLAFAVAGTVLAFRRDFKEAAGVFVVGVVSVLLATPAGLNLLKDTVASLFGAQ